jgi:hypothetical protein
MEDLVLLAGGRRAVACAIAHGYLREAKVFAIARIDPPRLRLLLRLVWQCGSAAWIGLGILLVLAPGLDNA